MAEHIVMPRFRWVHCRLEELKKCHSAASIRSALDSLPLSLDETYSRILQQIDRQNCTEARKLLQWLCFSERPLSYTEVITIAAFKTDGEPVFDPEKQPSDHLQKFQYLRDVCSSLIQIRTAKNDWKLTNEVISLADSSVKDWLFCLLESPRKSGKFYELSTAASHEWTLLWSIRGTWNEQKVSRITDNTSRTQDAAAGILD